MKLLAVALCGCCLLLGATTEARRPMRGRQLSRNDASSSSSSEVLPWDPQNSVNSPLEPVPAAQTIEGRQYYGGGGGYPGQGGQGGYPGQGGQGGYPGQGGQGGYPGQGGQGGYPGQGGSGGTGGGSGSGGGGGSGGGSGSGGGGGSGGGNGSGGGGGSGGGSGSGGGTGSGGGSGSGGGGGSGGSGGDTSNEIPDPPAGTKPGKPQRPPGCLKDRGQFPSPKSCSHYINCWDDVAIEQLCPNGLLFNEKRQYCDFDYNVKCGNRPKPTPRPPMVDGSKRCPELNGIHRNAKNCSEFFVCVAGVPNKFQCPRGLVFSEETQVCDYPNKVDCKGAWTPKPLPPTTETPQQPTNRPGGGGSGGGSGGGNGGGGGGGSGGGSGGGYPGQQPQPENPNPNPPYDPDRPELPGPLNPYNTNNFLRAKPEFWQQRQAVLHSELEQDIQAQKEAAELEEDSDSSTIQNPWEVIHTIPQEYAKVPCENGEVHRLTDACTSVVVCRSRRPQLINCQTGYAYDKPTDSCRPHSIAQC